MKVREQKKITLSNFPKRAFKSLKKRKKKEITTLIIYLLLMCSLKHTLDIFSIESFLKLDLSLMNCILDKHLPSLLSKEEIG